MWWQYEEGRGHGQARHETHYEDAVQKSAPLGLFRHEKGTYHKALILESIISFFSSKESLLGRQGISKAVRYLKNPFCCTGNCSADLAAGPRETQRTILAVLSTLNFLKSSDFLVIFCGLIPALEEVERGTYQ